MKQLAANELLYRCGGGVEYTINRANCKLLPGPSHRVAPKVGQVHEMETRDEPKSIEKSNTTLCRLFLIRHLHLICEGETIQHEWRLNNNEIWVCYWIYWTWRSFALAWNSNHLRDMLKIEAECLLASLFKWLIQHLTLPSSLSPEHHLSFYFNSFTRVHLNTLVLLSLVAAKPTSGRQWILLGLNKMGYLFSSGASSIDNGLIYGYRWIWTELLTDNVV